MLEAHIKLVALAKIAEWFSRDGAKLGYDYELGVCVYRGHEGAQSQTRCSVGVLIPDDVYEPEWEGVNAATLLTAKTSPKALGFDLAPEDSKEFATFLHGVQRVHDNIADAGGTARDFVLAMEVLRTATDPEAWTSTALQGFVGALQVAGHSELDDEVRAALEGDSNDAEHDALVSVAQTFGIEYDAEVND